MLVLESKHGLQLVLDYVVQTDTTPLVDDYRERAKSEISGFVINLNDQSFIVSKTKQKWKGNKTGFALCDFSYNLDLNE